MIWGVFVHHPDWGSWKFVGMFGFLCDSLNDFVFSLQSSGEVASIFVKRGPTIRERMLGKSHQLSQSARDLDTLRFNIPCRSLLTWAEQNPAPSRSQSRGCDITLSLVGTAASMPQ